MRVVIEKAAMRRLNNLPRSTRESVRRRLDEIAADPFAKHANVERDKGGEPDSFRLRPDGGGRGCARRPGMADLRAREASDLRAREASGEAEYVPIGLADRIFAGEHPVRAWRAYHGLTLGAVCSACLFGLDLARWNTVR